MSNEIVGGEIKMEADRLWQQMADELYRLRAEIARLQELLRGTGANRYWEGRWRDAEVEIDRLMVAIEKEDRFTMAAMDKAKAYWAALEEIVRNGDQGIHVPSPYEIAKAALTGEGTGFTWCEVVHVSDTEGTRGHGFMALVPNSTLAKEEK